MTAKEYVEKSMYMHGRKMALDLQKQAAEMNNTELNDSKEYIPDFAEAKNVMNMIERPAGFICRSSAGRLVRLLQPYNSDNYPGEPETLDAQWGFLWSDKPEHALPFKAISTSPYMKGNVCRENEIVYRALHDNIVMAPSEYPAGWERLSL